MRKENYQDFQGNDQYEGFCVDMLRELADILKFSFKIKLVDDGLYGAPEPNGSWTGMVGELINRVSSLPLPPFPSPVSLFLSLFFLSLSVTYTHQKHRNMLKCSDQCLYKQKLVVRTHTHTHTHTHTRSRCSPKPQLCCNFPCLKLPSKGSKTLI